MSTYCFQTKDHDPHSNHTAATDGRRRPRIRQQACTRSSQPTKDKSSAKGSGSENHHASAIVLRWVNHPSEVGSSCPLTLIPSWRRPTQMSWLSCTGRRLNQLERQGMSIRNDRLYGSAVRKARAAHSPTTIPSIDATPQVIIPSIQPWECRTSAIGVDVVVLGSFLIVLISIALSGKLNYPVAQLLHAVYLMYANCG